MWREVLCTIRLAVLKKLRRCMLDDSKHRSLPCGVIKLCGNYFRPNKPSLEVNQTYVITPNVRSFRSSAPAYAEIKTVNAPPFPDSVTEGDVKLSKKVGDAVAEDEVVMEIETDKTAMPVNAPAHGIITEIMVQNGTSVKTGQPLFKLKVTGVAPSKAAGAAAPAASAAAAPKTAGAPGSVFGSFALGSMSSGPPPPSSPVGGALGAFGGTVAGPPAKKPGPPAPKLPQIDPSQMITGARTEHRQKMSRMRLKIAERLKEAQNVNAMLTTFNEVDMSHIMSFRKTHQKEYKKKYGRKLGFMSAFVKASAYALQSLPAINAVIEGNEIVYRHFVDISIAVATPKGLVVPVIRNVESMNYPAIEDSIAALAKKARAGAITAADMKGGTFTISNGGVFGSLMGTPIINPPQSAILGMHGTFMRPVAVKGKVVVRPMMYIALTYDHRLVDGREAVIFLKTVKFGVEDPTTILAGL